MSGQKPRFREQRPIFVGASARRLRGLRTAGAMVLVPAVGFVAVLLIALVAELLIHSPLLPFAEPQKTAVAPGQPRPGPEVATSTTADPARLLVVVVVSTRQRVGLAPPRAASPLSQAKRRPVKATLKVTAERKVVAKRRPAVVAQATPKGMSVARRRPVVAAIQMTAKGRPPVKPAARRRSLTSAARVTANSGPPAKGRPVGKSGPVAKRRQAGVSREGPMSQGAQRYPAS